MSNVKKTILKKIKAKELMIAAENKDVEFSDVPQSILSILNCGLANSIQTELILSKINELVKVLDFVLLPNKSYSFIKFECAADAEIAYEKLNGSALGQNSVPLLLGYCSRMSEGSDNDDSQLPAGLILLGDFVDEELEQKLLSTLKWTQKDFDNSNELKHRQVQHFGYEFLYGTNNVDQCLPLDDKIPLECSKLWPKLQEKCPQFKNFLPDQLTVNRYEPGHGIPSHCDTHSCFIDPIISLSLNASIVMEFKNPSNSQHHSLFLPRRSLLIMSGESRYGWTHGIVPKVSDIVRSKSGFLTIQRRELRYSFTFRRLQIPPKCDCNFPHLCDIKLPQSPSAPSEVNEAVAAKLEIENVHNVYNEIGNHFSETRHSPWPNVENFIQSLPDNSIMVDVGCGNGKYLGLNEKIVKFGCDRSEALLKVCRERNFQVFLCDCLDLPVADDSIDACISIAVIHHLSTKERRLRAIREMLRVLKVGGLALIYVWAKDQQKENKKSSYLLQHQKKDKKIKSEEFATLSIDDSKIELPIHRNRTQFNHTNVLVPWKLKQKEIPESEQKIFLRYYHVFEDGELEALCRECGNVGVEKSYYDQGNHCVVLKKLNEIK